MKFVAQSPSQPIEFRVEPPKMFLGGPIVWSRDYRVEPVFLFEHRVGPSKEIPFVFVARWDLSHAVSTVLGSDLAPDSYFVTYQVVRSIDTHQVVHVLTQDASVPYAEEGASISYLSVTPRTRKSLSGAKSPRWVSVSNAIWPTDAGKPMLFLMDYDIPTEEAVTRLAGAGRVFLFARSDMARFAIVNQATDSQTIEQHYEDENRDD